MNECPDHPVWAHPRFFDLVQSRVGSTWRVKLFGLPPTSLAWGTANKTIYGKTVQEALDNALVHLMNDALWENP